MKRLFFIIIIFWASIAIAGPPASPPQSGGSGDMTKAVYDAGNDGSADTANALKANGANCSAGSSPLGVDASGAVESCTDYWTEAENTAAGYITGTSPTINTPALTLEDGNGAAPTADGRVKYDRTTERLQVGDGAATQEFYPGAHTTVNDTPANGETTVAASSNSVYDHINGSLHAWVVGATSVLTLNTPIVLDEATGNEVAMSLNYTVNKATSGNDTGLLVNMTDTASPGSSKIVEFKYGGTTKFDLDPNGNITGPNIITATSFKGNVVHTGAQTTLSIGAGSFFNNADNGIELLSGSSLTQATGEAFNAVAIIPTYNQTDTASATDLLINRTQTAVGSGEQNLIDAQVGGASKFRVDNAGYTQRQECFGELYETGGATDITVTTAGTYYPWANSTVGLESGNGYVDCDATTDSCVIESTTCAGTYKVSLTMSFSGSTGAVSCAVSLNGTESTKIMFKRVLAATPSIGAAAASGLLALVNTDAVSVECTNDTNGDVVTPEELNLNLVKIDS